MDDKEEMQPGRVRIKVLVPPEPDIKLVRSQCSEQGDLLTTYEVRHCFCYQLIFINDSALRALSSLRGLRGAPEVPPNVANVGTWLRKRNGGQKWVKTSRKNTAALQSANYTYLFQDFYGICGYMTEFFFSLS